jgi:uncharacterized Rmd1/YagE family protein
LVIDISRNTTLQESREEIASMAYFYHRLRHNVVLNSLILEKKLSKLQ